MSDGIKYFLLGIVLAVAAFAILMPYYRGRGGYRPHFIPGYYMPYYAHGGQAYRPGVLY